MLYVNPNDVVWLWSLFDGKKSLKIEDTPLFA